MSGGAYGYLCDAAWSLEELLAKAHELDRMAVRLRGMGPVGQRAADATEGLALYLRGIQRVATRHAEALQAVWHAVEWRDSADWSEEQMLEAIATYNQRRPG